MGGFFSAVILFWVIPWAILKIKDSCFHNYTPPKGFHVDHEKMSKDLSNGVSKDSVMDRTVNGWYDTPDKE